MTVALAVDYSTTFLKVLDSRLPIFCFFTLKRQKNNHNGKAPKFLIKKLIFYHIKGHVCLSM